MAKNGKSKREIHDYVLKQYPAGQYEYTVDSSLDEMEQTYRWDVSCQGSVPVAIKCFLDSDSYESFLHNVFRLECDADTLGAIGGAVAEEYYHGTGLDNKAIIDKYPDKYLKGMIMTVNTGMTFTTKNIKMRWVPVDIPVGIQDTLYTLCC